jgi:hypothetical protein
MLQVILLLPLINVKFAALYVGFSRSPPPYLSLVAGSNSTGGIGETVNNSTKKKIGAAASLRGANFASGGSGILDSTVRI